jgi:hypothetical protein
MKKEALVLALVLSVGAVLAGSDTDTKEVADSSKAVTASTVKGSLKKPAIVTPKKITNWSKIKNLFM